MRVLIAAAIIGGWILLIKTDKGKNTLMYLSFLIGLCVTSVLIIGSMLHAALMITR